MSEIHAHNVLNMLADNPMNEQEIRAAVTREFGEDAKFHTCSKQGMDIETLLSFLIQRQKVVQVEGDKWVLNAARMCSH
ncbi:YecH family metal-binding protein [Vibrio intestinalis]|uniref:YecH family metal-binding protein n=1 Tax=Vibrio intestinalis TaxID=2933291 RepID=UPI0021A46EDE|nr:YecH family metal-binding protein [Vibrio intestinalis]